MPVRKKISATGRASQELPVAADIGKVDGPFDEGGADVSSASETTESSRKSPETAGMPSNAPCAIPLPGKIMMEKGLRVTDVPEGLPLDAVVSAEPEDHTEGTDAPKSDLPSRRRHSAVELISKPNAHRSPPSFSAQPASPAVQKGRRIPASKSGHEEDRVALMRAPLAETNLGKDPESRSYIRGVLHTHPWHLRLGAVFSLLLIANLAAAIVSAFLLLASAEYPELFGWVPAWFLAFPLGLPVTVAGYLVWGISARCLICKQKLFVRSGALKHVKAHRLPCLGFVVPLCLHILAFHWFRCPSCGTPVRLRK